MPYQTVGSASTGGFFGWGGGGGWGYGYRGGNDLCALPRCICGILVLALLGGFGCTIAGVVFLSSAYENHREANIKEFNGYVEAWAGTAALMSAFTSSTPYSLKILGSVANATILQESETKYNTNKVFGDDSKDLTSEWTSVQYTSPSTSYSIDTPSTFTLEIQSKNTNTISGPFSFEQTIQKTWTCDNKAQASNGKTCSDGNNCGLDYDGDGCPPSSSSWNYQGKNQWYYDISSRHCLNYGDCYCQCTSGRNNGAKYRTHGYNGYDIDCLDQGALRRYCGYPSSAKKKCFYQDPVKNTCSNECSSNQKGKWDSKTGQCSVKQALTDICLVSDKENNNDSNLRRLLGKSSKDTRSVGASAPPDSVGCIWHSSNSQFMPTAYISVPYDAKGSSESFKVKLMSGKDPWYLGTLLTKGCNRKTSPYMCFGESQLTLFGRGVMFLTIGLIILCCPCITWYCCFREKKSTPRYNGNYSNAPQPQPNTMYRPIVQPPQTVPQQGGYGQPSYPVAQSQPQYMQPQQQPVGYAQQQQPVAYAQPQKPVAYAQY